MGWVATMAADLKRSVVLVEPEYREMRDFLDEYALILSRNDYPATSRALLSLRSGISGSGVVVRSGDSLLVLTNQHVVGIANQARVRVQDGSNMISYRHCPIVAISPSTDLALILLPDSTVLAPLAWDEEPLHDAQEVFAAGFPGLAGKPSWQVTKGIVSNSALYHEDLLGKHQAAVQHTAPIDPGSSGGPLLVAKGKEDYALVGINTWKAGRRDGVGIAIPTPAIHHFLAYRSEEEHQTDEERSTEWNELLRADAIQAAQYLSTDYLMTRSTDEWETILHAMGSTYRDYIDESEHASVIDVIRYVFAIEMVRYAMAGGEAAQFTPEWAEVQGRHMIVGLIYPTLSKKQVLQATSRLRK